MKRLRILSSVLSIALALSVSVSAFASTLYEFREETAIASGITLENIKRLTSAGWQNISIVTADLTDDNFRVNVLTGDENISTLSNVKTLAENNNTIVAVNGDFFSWKKDETSLGTAVGGVISDGELLTSLTSPWNFATVAQKATGPFVFDYIDCAVTVTSSDGTVTEIEHINKYDDLTKPIIYTPHWGALSPGSSGTQKEIVVEGDKVTAINHDKGPVEIPEDGFIISFLSDVTPQLLETFKVDDKAELSIKYMPDFENIRFAIGAGTLLLKDGQKTEITNDIPGNQPRTAIGVSRDSKKLYFVTVDGRQENAKGVSLDYMAELMAEIGANDAANLDGGGSTQLVVKSPQTNQQTVANSPSDKYLRKVANGIGINITSEENLANHRFITIHSEYDRVFANTEVYLEAKLHDGTGKIIETLPGELEWDVPSGHIEDGFYIPKTSGRVMIRVSYSGSDDFGTDYEGASAEEDSDESINEDDSKDDGENDESGEDQNDEPSHDEDEFITEFTPVMGAEATKELLVLDKPAKLETGKKEYSVKSGESIYMSLKGITADGYGAYINLRDVGVTTDSSAIEIVGNNIKGIKKGTAVVTFDFENVQTSVVIRVDGDDKEVTIPEDIYVKDPVVKESDDDDKDGFKFAVFGNTSDKNTLTEKLVVLKYASLLNEKDYPLAIFAGEEVLTPDNIKTEIKKAGEYSYTIYEDSAFISMDNSKNSVTGTDVTQWESFFEDIGKTKADNIFIILPKDMTGQTSMDLQMLCHVYETTLKDNDKMMYVISAGDESITNTDGIKHISVKGVDAIKSPASAVEDAVYYEFTVNGSRLTCTRKNIFEQAEDTAENKKD